MTLTVRSASVTGAVTAGRALTHAEMDANWAHVIQSANQTFLPSGIGGISRTVSQKLADIVSTADYTTRAQYDTARALLTASIGVGGLDLTRTAGLIAAGSVYLNNWATTFTGDVGGTSDVAGLRVFHQSNGANAVSQSIAGRFQNQTTGAGAITTQEGVLGEVRLDGAGNVGSAIGIGSLLYLTSTGGCTVNAQMFRAFAPSITGSGTIPSMFGFRASNLGHAQVVDVYSFYVEDQTSATGSMYGFYSGLTSGTGKWGFYGGSSALNAFSGRTLFGSVTDNTLDQIQITALNASGAALIARSDTLYSNEGGSVKAANLTTPAKLVQIGYDGTADVGYIKASHLGTANKDLALQPVANAVLIGKVTSDGTSLLQVNGTVSFGTNTAKAAEAFASFITIKDSGGTARKLMVCV